MKDPIIILDNVKCMEILTELGIMDKLYPEPPYTRAHSFFEYRDCHCVACYDKGHAEDKDNGFSIIMIPYDLMPIEQSHAMLEDIMEKTQIGTDGTWREVNLGKDLQ